ncbi:hypothetical protein Areg01_83030 [Actinoplanes regularis]|nr:hypothetical protein Areg01_83030 [Actinoplanes regularis]
MARHITATPEFADLYLTEESSLMSRRRIAAVLAALICFGATIAAAAGHSSDTGDAVWVRGLEPTLPIVARYRFDGPGEAAWSDVSGNGHTLTPVAGNDGVAALTPHGAGTAVRFPALCDSEPCPRLALRSPSTAALNPGSRPLRYGASVLLDPSDTSDGQNVLQKGFSAEGSQYKLQIDGRAAHPSCALVDTERTIHLAVAGITVADGSWHAVECRREATALTVLIDGSAQGSARIPAELSIDNDQPLSIGAKSAYGDNDQYRGLLDDVWVAIG